MLAQRRGVNWAYPEYLVLSTGYVYDDWMNQVEGEKKLVGYIDVTPDMPTRPPKVCLLTTPKPYFVMYTS